MKHIGKIDMEKANAAIRRLVNAASLAVKNLGKVFGRLAHLNARNRRARKALERGDFTAYNYYNRESFRRKFRTLSDLHLNQITNDPDNGFL